MVERATKMNIQKILFSKLIKACQLDWIPDSDTLYGEDGFLFKPERDLKQLVYHVQKEQFSQKASVAENGMRPTGKNRLSNSQSKAFSS